jgi:hypothetical protein
MHFKVRDTNNVYEWGNFFLALKIFRNASVEIELLNNVEIDHEFVIRK